MSPCRPSTPPGRSASAVVLELAYEDHRPLSSVLAAAEPRVPKAPARRPPAPDRLH